MKKLLPGQLVLIVTDGLNLTPDGFATGNAVDGGLQIFEHIDMRTYPSCYDFTGKNTKVRTGDIATICQYMGRPDCINKNPQWFCYDIYEIFIHGEIRQIFRQNIKLLYPKD